MTSIEFHPRLKKDFRRLPKPFISEIRSLHFPHLAQDPSLGKPLRGRLSDIYSYRLAYQGVQYRMAYIVHGQTVTILMIDTRENFYRTLEQRIT